MPMYRLYRMKDAPCESFRWASHTGGLAIVKFKDYQPGRQIEAPTPYALWKLLSAGPDPLRPGDLLESITPDGAAADLSIVKYIGFEPAQWYVPEVKPGIDAAAIPVIVSAES